VVSLKASLDLMNLGSSHTNNKYVITAVTGDQMDGTNNHFEVLGSNDGKETH